MLKAEMYSFNENVDLVTTKYINIQVLNINAAPQAELLWLSSNTPLCKRTKKMCITMSIFEG